ncbi:MAG: tRNA (adenosine(37)-N6)-threonylcarbamoyltransferase complex transferase subunit TsaD, partial [Candidatus Aquicultor sp.]
GVSANEVLRIKMAEAVKINFPKTKFLVPEREYTTDNAAMIATAAAFLVYKRKTIPFNKLKVDPSLQLK